MDSLPDNLRAERARARLTMQELASLAGVSFSTIESIENRRHVPKMTTVIAIATALKVSIDRLLTPQLAAA